MDNFTVAVLVGDVLVIVSLIFLIIIDKKGKSSSAEAEKPSGKRPA
jgi:hypothetical protein